MLKTSTRQNDELAEVFNHLIFNKTYLVGRFNPSEKFLFFGAGKKHVFAELFLAWGDKDICPKIGPKKNLDM